jgi:hypothetical protein
MKKILISILTILILGGCVTTDLVPEGYQGPTAIIRDRAVTNSNSQVDFFYVNKINGQRIHESRGASVIANRGRGFHMDPVVVERPVLVEPTKFEIVGRTEYAAPILAFANKVYEVKGAVEFTPVDGQVYIVTGILREDYSAVWIENAQTREIVGEKIEIHGSAALNFFQK